MHEYYLTRDKGENIFSQPTQAARLSFLLSGFEKDLPVINEDILFTPDPAIEHLYDDHKIKIIPSYSGFKLALKCRKETLLNGTVVYSPFISLPDEFCIRVMAREIHSVRKFSGLFDPRPFNAKLYFSNNDLPSARNFPFLSSAVPAFVMGNNYEQSEIALHGVNVRAFLNNGAVDPWLTMPGTDYINSNDACLLPLTFLYRFLPSDNVSTASFQLKDAASMLIKKIDFTDTHPFQVLSLDFHTKDNLVNTIDQYQLNPQQVYRLEVTGNNGYARTFTGLLFAGDSLQVDNYSAMIDLSIKPANAAFHLLDGSGHLLTRILPNGTRVDNPVFELWMNSKLVYWQYRNNRQHKIKLTPTTQDLLADNSGILISKNPIPMTYTPVKLKKPDNSFMFLPNPDPLQEVTRSGKQLLLDIQVPESNMFPLV